jgi:CheY-like chemotaxis protein
MESESGMSRRRILVVDDSALIRQVITDALVPAGFDVSAAADGSAALACLAEAPPDLIIADILMPVMDGWALCEEVRRAPATRDIPIIILTTERDIPKRIKGLEMGADDYVCKPFSKEELVARVETVLRRARRPGGEPAAGAAGQAGSEGAAHPAGLSGHTDLIAMSDLLQMLSINDRSGTLHLWGESVARIYFGGGRILNAETQSLTGEKALFRIMAWPSARFEFEPGDPVRRIETVIAGATSMILMEGFAHLDELRDLVAGLPASDTHLRVRRARAHEIDSMDLSTIQRIVLHTAAGRGATMAQIVDTVPEKDLDAYRALSDLLRKGILETVPDERAR